MKGFSCLHSKQMDSTLNCSMRGHFLQCGKAEKCKVTDNVCSSIYKNQNNKWYPMVQDCFYLGPDRKYCHKNMCVLRKLKYFPTKYHCCCFGHMCNKNMIPPLIQTTVKPATSSSTMPVVIGNESPNSSVELTAVVGSSAAVIIICIIVLGSLWYIEKKRKTTVTHSVTWKNSELRVGESVPWKNSELQVDEIIQNGRYSCVYKGTNKNEVVAVKCYSRALKKHWQMEKQIFEACLEDNEHILLFIKSMQRVVGNAIEFCIVTEYHSLGSLADYLMGNKLSLEELLNFVESIANGLAFLHNGSTNRPVIAHRDVKSMNILVKDNLSCCLSDFGVSVPFWDNSDFFSVEVEQVGTIRYLSPEILQGSIGFNAEAFLQADMYAFALVMWELLTRCDVGEVVDFYVPPFYMEVGRQPSLKDMITCICEKKTRPDIKRQWKDHEVLVTICRSIVECWDEESVARLSASCVEERVIELRRRNSTASGTSNNSERLPSSSCQKTVHALIV